MDVEMEYQLSATLKEHDDDVRDVAFPHPSLVFSASRDATVRVWRSASSSPPTFDCSISSHVQSFVNAVTFVPPTSENVEGLVVSAGKDTVIDVRRPSAAPESDAERLLLGHAQNICALDVSADGSCIISGSWDGTARVWNTKTWECDAVLEGHEGSVWAVLSFDSKTVITGCADRLIRLYDPRGKLYGELKGSQDVVRALCRLDGHTSGADFASAGNDAIIRLWKLDGSQAGQLHGHENFIYSIASLPEGQLVSSGEDRTVRVWKNYDCIQTITHPAISVWSVASCAQSEDFVSGASDKIVRVFSRSKDRQAGSEEIKAFEDSVKDSSIPKQQLGDLNKEQLPGPDFLQRKSGTKEGQVQMIQEPNGSVSAHQWSQATQSWLNVGTVVDAAGSTGRKATYGGQDYDFVFDVDIEDGKPPLKLPYNLSQNPYEAATKFLENNELPISYLDQVAAFITTNSQGAAMDSTQVSHDSEPWGSEARYRPGDAASPSQAVPSRPKLLPQTSYLSIKTANVRTIIAKIVEFNKGLKDEGSLDLVINDADIAALRDATDSLQRAIAKPSVTVDRSLAATVGPVFKTLRVWPPGKRLPVLDFARLLAAIIPDIASATIEGEDVVSNFLTGGFDDSDRENNVMLAIRGLVNVFEHEAGRSMMDARFVDISQAVQRTLSSTNRNLQIALGTLFVNYSVFYTSSANRSSRTSTDRSLKLIDGCIELILACVDSEAVYRALVAFGTLITISASVAEAARSNTRLSDALGRAQQRLKEPRIKALTDEIGQTLQNPTSR